MSSLRQQLRADEVMRVIKPQLDAQETIPAPMNPDSEPPVDPAIRRRFEVDVANRINRGLRLEWNKVGGFFVVKEKSPANVWVARFSIYSKETSFDPKGRLPFKMPDERDVQEFCEANLEIKYDTGDRDKDAAAFEADSATAMAARKATERKEGEELRLAILTGGDVRRFAKGLEHAGYFGDNGSFRGHYQVQADLKKPEGE